MICPVHRIQLTLRKSQADGKSIFKCLKPGCAHERPVTKVTSQYLYANHRQDYKERHAIGW